MWFAQGVVVQELLWVVCLEPCEYTCYLPKEGHSQSRSRISTWQRMKVENGSYKENMEELSFGDMPVMAIAQALHISNLASRTHVELLVWNRGESCTNVFANVEKVL